MGDSDALKKKYGKKFSLKAYIKKLFHYNKIVKVQGGDEMEIPMEEGSDEEDNEEEVEEEEEAEDEVGDAQPETKKTDWFDTCKMRLSVEYDAERCVSGDINTVVFVKDNEEAKPRKVNVRTISDLEQYLTWKSKFQMMVMVNKLWASKAVKDKKREYGVTLKIMQMVIIPGTVGGSIRSEFEAYAFSDEDEDPNMSGTTQQDSEESIKDDKPEAEEEEEEEEEDDEEAEDDDGEEAEDDDGEEEEDDDEEVEDDDEEEAPPRQETPPKPRKGARGGKKKN